MIVKMNGQYLMTVGEHREEQQVIVTQSGVNPKLKQLAITLWTVSGSFFVKQASAATFYENIQPLFQVFQEMALGIGALAIMVGLVLLVFKKRWGTVTLKTTLIIVVGIFMVPSALMLLAIVGTYLNDALYEALKGVQHQTVPVGGK